VGGNHGKPKAGFPPFPPTRGNRKTGDFHIPTATAIWTFFKTNQSKAKAHLLDGWKSGNPKPGFPLSHRPGQGLRRKEKSHPVFGCAIPFKPIQSNSRLMSLNLNTLLPMSSE